MTSAIAPFKYCYVSSMVPHGLRTQLGGSIRNRNSLPIVLLLLFSCSVVSDSLRPHELQHIRLPCPSLSLRVCSNSCALSWWCHPTISSSVALFSSCPQYFSAKEWLITPVFLPWKRHEQYEKAKEKKYMFNLKINLRNCFSKVVVLFHVPASSVWEIQLFYILTSNYQFLF